MRIDLHSHSTASDGLEAPEAVVSRAAAAGVSILALTDHDTVGGYARAAGALRPGQVLVPGAELSCSHEGSSVHLLAYLFDPEEPALGAELARVRTDRERRARAMVERLADLGVPVTWERVRRAAGGEAVGRPHVARAMVEAGVIPDVGSAFTPEWLAPGGRAHVPKYAPDPVRAIGLIGAAGGVSVLAHPYAPARDGGLRDEQQIGRLASAGLAGIEVDHPAHDAAVREKLRALAAELALAVTGGSDHHGDPDGPGLGVFGTDPREYDWLVSQASGAAPVVG